jgi:hypothetical protein
MMNMDTKAPISAIHQSTSAHLLVCSFIHILRFAIGMTCSHFFIHPRSAHERTNRGDPSRGD